MAFGARHRNVCQTCCDWKSDQGSLALRCGRVQQHGPGRAGQKWRLHEAMRARLRGSVPGVRALSPGLADNCSYRLPSAAADPLAILKGRLGAESGRLVWLLVRPEAALQSVQELLSLPVPCQDTSSMRSPDAQAATVAEPRPQHKPEDIQADLPPMVACSGTMQVSCRMVTSGARRMMQPQQDQTSHGQLEDPALHIINIQGASAPWLVPACSLYLPSTWAATKASRGEC